jgi:hypothetical protein
VLQCQRRGIRPRITFTPARSFDEMDRLGAMQHTGVPFQPQQPACCVPDCDFESVVDKVHGGSGESGRTPIPAHRRHESATSSGCHAFDTRRAGAVIRFPPFVSTMGAVAAA